MQDTESTSTACHHKQAWTHSSSSTMDSYDQSINDATGQQAQPPATSSAAAKKK
jgi:hypothetical protein